jgi:hypothetical protein
MSEHTETKRTYGAIDVLPWLISPFGAALNWASHRYAEPAVSAA